MTFLKRMLRGLGYLAIFGVIAGGGYLFWQNQKAKVEARKAELAKLAAAPSAPAISVVKVAVADFVETVMVSGSLVPREETIVSPEIEGYRVVELFADEGSEVKKGQVLARLVPDQLDAQARPERRQPIQCRSSHRAGREPDRGRPGHARKKPRASSNAPCRCSKSGYLSESRVRSARERRPAGGRAGALRPRTR